MAITNMHIVTHLPSISVLPPTTRNPPKHSMEVDDLEEDAGLSALIMVVEDDFLISMQTESALTEAGFEVVSASSGEEALELAALHNPALAVMDIRLSGNMDGVDAALELFRTRRLRSIFATAHSDPELHARATAAEPAGWLVKPYSMPSLLAAVRHALANQR